MADPDSRSGRHYFDADILEFAARVHAPHDPALARAFDAPAAHGLPAIQLAASEARAVELFLRLAGARKVIELGTLAGYSALRIARALPLDGLLVTVEASDAHADIAEANLAAAALVVAVRVARGKALDVLPTLEAEGPWDAIFIDADKGNYDRYGRWAALNLRPGGLLLADNVYLFGRLLEDSAEAEAMRRFHEESAAAFDTVCLPTPDGLLLGIRR